MQLIEQAKKKKKKKERKNRGIQNDQYSLETK